MSLDIQYDPQNIFAKMLRREIPNTTIYEDDDVLSFLDIFPQSHGHTLVIPKKSKAVNFLDIDPETLAELIKRTQIVATAINEALNPDGIRIIQFNGEAAGQTVFHIHFHIIPIWTDRDMKPHGTSPAETSDLKAIAEQISACM